MSKGEWKKIVNDKVKNKENKEWTTTSLFIFICIIVYIVSKCPNIETIPNLEGP